MELTEVEFALLAAFPLGLCIFMLWVRSFGRIHLKSVKAIVSFFFWPYPPSKMFIVRELGGKSKVFYDSEFEITKAKDRYFVRTIRGDEYVSSIDPEKAADIASMYEARAPRGQPSPMGLSWRWIVAAAITLFMVYVALVSAWIPPIRVEETVIAGKVYKLAVVEELNVWKVMYTTVAFSIVFTWFLVNINRMADRSIEYMMFVSQGINPPVEYIVPALTPDSKIGVLEHAKLLGRKIDIHVPKEVKEILEEVVKKTKKSLELAAAILSKIASAEAKGHALADMSEELFKLRKAGETAAMIRLHVLPTFFTPRRLLVLILIFAIGLAVGFGLGFMFGSTWAISPTAPPQYPYQYPGQYPYQYPYNVSTPGGQGVVPAQPPPPPLFNQTST